MSNNMNVSNVKAIYNQMFNVLCFQKSEEEIALLCGLEAVFIDDISMSRCAEHHYDFEGFSEQEYIFFHEGEVELGGTPIEWFEGVKYEGIFEQACSKRTAIRRGYLLHRDISVEHTVTEEEVTFESCLNEREIRWFALPPLPQVELSKPSFVSLAKCFLACLLGCEA